LDSPTVAIPATIKKAVEALSGIGTLLRAKEWERAAIVYAFTTAGGETFREFAKRGIVGLSHHQAVSRYHGAWQAAIDQGKAIAVSPGDNVTLPDLTWPQDAKLQELQPEDRAAIEEAAERFGVGAGKVADIVRNPKAVKAATYAREAIAEAAREAMRERYLERNETMREAREQSKREAVERLREQGEDALADDLEASNAQPAPARHLRGRAQDEAIDRDQRMEPWRESRRALIAMSRLIHAIKREQKNDSLEGETEILANLDTIKSFCEWAEQAIHNGGPTDWDAEFGKLLDGVGDQP